MQSNKLEPIAKDTIIFFSSGEYSDYSAVGLFKATKDIDVSAVRDQYISLHPEQMTKYEFKEDMFMQFLKDEDYLEELPYKEWYLGAYSKISEMRVDDGTMSFT